MPLRPNMEVADYLSVIARRRWFSIFSFILVLFGASVFCVVTPELYKSTTTILIVPQRVPEDFVRSTVSAGIEDRLATIQQEVSSRTRLTAVMDELGLFKDARRKAAPEEVIELMRKRLEVNVAQPKTRGGRDRNTEAFTISFTYEDRQLAMLATSRLASFFIDENLKTREQQAVGTSEFLDSQLQETKKRLEEQEERVKHYKLRFMGELPQELQANLSVLSRLQDQMKTNADSARAAEDRKVFLEAQISSLERMLAVPPGDNAAPVAGVDPVAPLLAELTARRAQLADMSARYTDRYPQVIKARQEIATLEKRIEEVRNSPPPPTSAGRPGLAAVPTGLAKEQEEIRRMRAQTMAIGQGIASLKTERAEIEKRMAAFQARVDQAPRREQEMIALTRDYENRKRTYDDLLKKKLDADIAQNLEKRQKGEQFQILDPANLPEEPFSPDRKKVFGIALFAAFALAIGGAIGLEGLDQTLRDKKEFAHFFEVPVLAAIPVIRDEAYERRQAIRRTAILGGLVAFTAALSVFLVLYSGKIRAILKV